MQGRMRCVYDMGGGRALGGFGIPRLDGSQDRLDLLDALLLARLAGQRTAAQHRCAQRQPVDDVERQRVLRPRTDAVVEGTLGPQNVLDRSRAIRLLQSVAMTAKLFDLLVAGMFDELPAPH